jgi:hypothetical protein
MSSAVVFSDEKVVGKGYQPYMYNCIGCQFFLVSGAQHEAPK